MDPGETVISLPHYPSAGAARPWFLSDSEWGYVARFEKALAEKLDECASAPPEAAALLRSGASRFSQATLPALNAAKTCGIAIDGDGSKISLKTWMAVTASPTPPAVFDRAKTIVFRRSPLTPDYSHTLWDYDRTVFRESVFTWGPMHATLGEGCTLVKFLGYLSQRTDLQDAMDFSFGSELLPRVKAGRSLVRMVRLSWWEASMVALAGRPVRRWSSQARRTVLARRAWIFCQWRTGI